MRADDNARDAGQRRVHQVTAGVVTLGVAGALATAGYVGAHSATASTTDDTTKRQSQSNRSSSSSSSANTNKTGDERSSQNFVSPAPSDQPPAATSGGS